MPALRRLFHRRGSAIVLRARSDVVSVPTSGLLLRPQRSGPPVKQAQLAMDHFHREVVRQFLRLLPIGDPFEGLIQQPVLPSSQ